MKISALLFGILTLYFALATHGLTQENLVLQSGTDVAGSPYTGISDAILISGIYSRLNYGATNSLWIGAGTDEDINIRRSLLRFDLQGVIPEGKKIAYATLTLHCIQGSDVPLEWEVYAVSPENASWVEGGNTKGTAETGVCSWDYMANFYQPWGGGEGLGEVGAGYAEIPVFTDSRLLRNKETVAIELSPELIEAWRKGENGGLLLRVADENNVHTFIRFASSESPDETLRPSLEIGLQP